MPEEPWYRKTNALEHWIQHKVRSEIRQDKDQVVLITGAEGSGKSNLAWLMARAVDPDFSADRMCFTGEEFRTAAVRADKYAALVLDEAVHDLFSRSAMSKGNKQMAEFLTICRERNLVMFILIPNINHADKLVKDHRAHWWWNVEKRGVAMLRKPQRHIFASDTWWDGRFRLRNIPRADGPAWTRYLEKKRAHTAGFTKDGLFDKRAPSLADQVEAEIERGVRSLVKHDGFRLAVEARPRAPSEFRSFKERRFWTGPLPDADMAEA